MIFFFFMHKTAYEMRMIDWSSDVCSSYLQPVDLLVLVGDEGGSVEARALHRPAEAGRVLEILVEMGGIGEQLLRHARSEEHTSELQSLMRISYAVFCLKKKTKKVKKQTTNKSMNQSKIHNTTHNITMNI